MIVRDWIVILAVLVTILAGAVLRLKKVTDIRWNMIYVLPMMISAVHFGISSRNIFMYVVYFAALLEVLLLFLRKKKVFPAVISVVSVLFAVVPLVLTLYTNAGCYASFGYADAFRAFHEDMKMNYALQKWKETDFDAKYEEYIVLFEEADRNKDKKAYTKAMLSYMASYQDGHVQMADIYEVFGIGSTRNIQNVYTDVYKNYYGMTLIRLDSGEYVAANVEKGGSADKAGIHNGSVIVKWNGTDIAKQLEEIKTMLPVNCTMFADSENIERFKPFFLSCMGEESMEVGFLDAQGNEKSVTLQSMGNGYKYLYQTIGLFLQKSGKEEEDISYRKLEDGVGYLKIKSMGDDYDGIRSLMEGYLAQMKEEKIASLVIDVRNNEGGEDEAGVILAEQFAAEDLFYLKETAYDNVSGNYKEIRTLRMNAKAAINVPVYLLVNSSCISAGEGFVYNMAKLPQVTVAGIQGTNGSFGSIEGIKVLPEGLIGAFPSIACLDEDGEVMIDSKKDGMGGIKPAVVIPVDQKAVEEIFKEDYDYELEYLLGML